VADQHVSGAEDVDDCLPIAVECGGLFSSKAMTGKIHRDRIVPTYPQLRDEAIPTPRSMTATVDKNESHQRSKGD
jgi:hypothetical protein